MGMRIPLSIFVQFSTLLVLGLVWFYQKADNYFIENDGSKIQIQTLRSELEHKEFEAKVALLESEKIKIQTLSLLQKENLLPDNELVKEHLTQGLRSPASVQKLDFSLLRIEELRTLFKEKKYNEVIVLGEGMLRREKSFVVKPEVLFFLSESYFLNRQYEKSVDKINQMVSLFPEHVMTGYALLRLANISEKSDQFNEAEAIYKIIATQFKDRALVVEAKRLLANLSE
jgi:tetratricopeptide (TPR) repeat protein